MTRFAISIGIAAWALCAHADGSIQMQVEKQIAVADSAFVKKDLKLLLSTVARDFKGYDHKGNLVANAASFENLRRMFDQSRNIVSTTRILRFRWDGKIASLVTDNYLGLYVTASGNHFEAKGQNEDTWAKVNGVFKMQSSRTLRKEEFLNGRLMHGGVIQ